MTTTITIDAHCNFDTEVLIKTVDKAWEKAGGIPFRDVVIQDGESHTCCVYDDRIVTVQERSK